MASTPKSSRTNRRLPSPRNNNLATKSEGSDSKYAKEQHGLGDNDTLQEFGKLFCLLLEIIRIYLLAETLIQA